MKIIQLNIWGGKLGQQIIDFLQTEQPDFVCMQEVNDLKGRAGYKFFATLDEIKEEVGFADAFMSPTYSSRYMERKLEYGNAILSKLPFTTTQTVFTRGQYQRNFEVTRDDSNIRNLQIATVELDKRSGKSPGKIRLHILNHHGYHLFGTKIGDAESLRATQIIADSIDLLTATNEPIILCGDFNLAPNSQSLAILNSRLTNLSIVHHLRRTYNQFSAVHEVCDYIFINDRIKPRHFQMSKALLSDHKALILEFDV
jgi:endonuclease/exonuclease/phosphatase family metal-dependent hydrolase